MFVVKVQALGQIPVARLLQAGETRVLLMRHPEHEDNIVSQPCLRDIYDQGQELAKRGFRPTVVFSSPAPRAIIGGYATMCGIHDSFQGRNGQGFKLPDFPTLPELGDFSSHASADLQQRVKKYKAASDLKGDDVFWRLCQTDIIFLREIESRGLCARSAILRIVFGLQPLEQTVLIPTHGICVLETAITHLIAQAEAGSVTQVDIANPPHKFSRGQIAELIFQDGRLQEVNYFLAP